MPDNYQDISSAPKDGTVILTWWRDVPVFAAWARTEAVKMVSPWWAPWKSREVSSKSQDGWHVLMLMRDGQYGLHGSYAPFSPLYWQPLPSPPTDKEPVG